MEEMREEKIRGKTKKTTRIRREKSYEIDKYPA